MHHETHQKLKVRKTATQIVGNTSRVITRPHIPENTRRISGIIERIVNLPDTAAEKLLL